MIDVEKLYHTQLLLFFFFAFFLVNSFALRAKTIKNKPKVNDIVPQTTVMKRLEQRINELQKSLEEERRKNQQLKVAELEKELLKESTKFINSTLLNSLEKENQNRRRTWCGVATNNSNTIMNNDMLIQATNDNILHKTKLPVKGGKYTSRLQTPKHYNPVGNNLAAGSSPPVLADESESVSSTPVTSRLSALSKIPENGVKSLKDSSAQQRTPQVLGPHLKSSLSTRCLLTPRDSHDDKKKSVPHLPSPASHNCLLSFLSLLLL